MRGRKLLVLFATLLLGGCNKAVQLPTPGTLVVLVDRTASISGKASTGYGRYFTENVLPSIAPGQRLLIESITDETTLSNPPLRVVDATMPPVQAPKFRFSDDYRTYERHCVQSVARQEATYQAKRSTVVVQAREAFVAPQAARSTYIVDGIEDAAEVLTHGAAPHRLVIFTDGVEDSEEDGVRLHFDEAGFWQHHRPEAVVEALKVQHRVPNLANTRVYVVGASARRPEAFRSNEAFWRDFFTAAGVSPAEFRYGHSPSWEEDITPESLQNTLCRANETH